MIGLPAVEIIKTSPLAAGHWLYAVTERGRRRKEQTCVVVCSCGVRSVVAPVTQYQGALDLARRNHGRRIGV